MALPDLSTLTSAQIKALGDAEPAQQAYLNSDYHRQLVEKKGDINQVRLQSNGYNTPFVNNFNKLMGMGLVGQAYQYLYDNQRFFSYDPTKKNQSAFGIWNQVAQQIGQGNVSGLVNRMGNNAGTGIFDQFRDSKTRNWRSYLGQLEETTNLQNQYNQYRRQFRPGGRGGLSGSQWPGNNPAGASTPSDAARQIYGDYTYSRYDDGMQHLAQLNDPLWKTYGNPNRGEPYNPTSPAPQPATAATPATAAQYGSGGLSSTGFRTETRPQRTGAFNFNTQSAPTGPAAPQPTTAPAVPQVPQAGTQTNYTTDPSRFQWGSGFTRTPR